MVLYMECQDQDSGMNEILLIIQELLRVNLFTLSLDIYISLQRRFGRVRFLEERTFS